MDLIKKIENISGLISNTPIVEIGVRCKNQIFSVFAKCEMFNLSGSIKDRCVYNILFNAIKEGCIDKNTVLWEASSGNTGISLACLGGYLGLPVNVVLPKNVSAERKKIISMYGANVMETEDNINTYLTQQTKGDKCAFLLNQFSNKYNFLAHYNGTANEITSTLNANRIIPSGFCAGVGTGGTFMGISTKLKECFPKINLVALQSENVDLLNFGCAGKHLLQGWATQFTPELYNKELPHSVLSLNDNDCVFMAQKLCKKLGLGVGITAGANFLGCVISAVNNNLKNVVTVFPDDNKKYLSTVLSEKVFESDFVKRIEFTFMRTL